MSDGKRNNLSAEQINRLNHIGKIKNDDSVCVSSLSSSVVSFLIRWFSPQYAGFKWSTGGRGRYNHEAEPHVPFNPALPQDEQIAPNPTIKGQGIAAPVQNSDYASGSSSSAPEAPSYPPPYQYFNRFPGGVDPQVFNEYYANNQRFAQQGHQNNDPNFSYLQYAYHMNQLNQLNNPAMFAAKNGNGVNGQSPINGQSLNNSHHDSNE